MTRPISPGEVELEDWEERAAIRQFVGGANRKESERAAALELFGKPELPAHVAAYAEARSTLELIAKRRAQLGG